MGLSNQINEGHGTTSSKVSLDKEKKKSYGLVLVAPSSYKVGGCVRTRASRVRRCRYSLRV